MPEHKEVEQVPSPGVGELTLLPLLDSVACTHSVEASILQSE